MLKILTVLLISLYLHEFSVNSQGIDTNFCNIALIVSDDGQNLPLPSQNISKYQANVERNNDLEKVTEEITEYYDSVNNIGISINYLAGKKISTYSYYNTDELLLIDDNKCVVFKLSQAFSLSPFFVVTQNGQEHIISGLGYLLLPNSNITFAYLGSKNRLVRNIPVREWQTCLFSKKDNSTLKLTVSFSNTDAWTMQTPGLTVPIQFKIEAKKPDGSLFTEYNAITQYRPDLLIKEEDFSVPSGVYCPGRTNQKPLPKIPNAFSYLTHKALSGVNTNSLTGTLEVLRVEQDFNKKLHRYDFLSGTDVMTEIHDYDIGLSYSINNSEDLCTINLLNLLNVSDAQRPAEFFSFDQDPPFQYVGQRRVRGINCDVWAAPRAYRNVNSTYEWYFMADGWVTQETSGVYNNEPVMLKINFNLPTSTINVKVPLYFQIYNFDESTIDIADFDVGRCTSIARQKLKLTFSSNYATIKSNQLLFKEGLILAIQKTAQISLLRISQLKLSFVNNTVSVIFTLLEKSPISGNDRPSGPDFESSVAIDNLRSSIKGSSFVVSFKDSTGQAVGVVADINSFSILSSKDNNFIQKQESSDNMHPRFIHT